MLAMAVILPALYQAKVGALGLEFANPRRQHETAALRQHKLSRARELFERARELDDGNFAAFLGIGAAIEHDHSGALRRVGRLPEAPDALPPPVAEVLVDWKRRAVLEEGVAELDEIAVGQLAAFHPLPIDQRSIPRAQILDLPSAEDGLESGMSH